MKQQGWTKRKGMIFLIVAVPFAIAMVVFSFFNRNHFLKNTMIEGIDCSGMSIEEAMQEIELKLEDSIVTLNLVDGTSYGETQAKLGITLDRSKFEDIFASQHANKKSSREYKLADLVFVDKEKIRSFLMQIPLLQGEFITEPKEAHLVWDGINFSIEKEIVGIRYDFEKTLEYTVEKISQNVTNIELTIVEEVVPNVVEKDFESGMEFLNSVLNSDIRFELSNGEIVTLDSNTISTWISQDEKGIITIDVDSGVTKFVDKLSDQVDEANKTIEFIPSEKTSAITLSVPTQMIAKLDKKAEIARIEEILGHEETISEKPIYDRECFSEKLSSRIEVDLTRQHVWLYKDGKLVLDTPCVTGNTSKDYDTPTGIYYLLNKNRDVFLEGYNSDGSKYKSFVKYWMRYYNGYGLHDASWRNKFGGDIYKTNGSHGCTNLPTEAAKVIYENIDSTMPIIFYKS